MSNRPMLCEVIAVPTMAELRAARDRAAGADLVELRLDMVERPDVAAALEGRRGPVLVTCRAAWDGGHFTGSEEERQRLLRDALAAGAEFVDIEWKTEGIDRWLRPEDRPRVVLSLHDFQAMPGDLSTIVREMRRVVGPGVVKVAGQAQRLRDLLPMIDIGRAHQATGERIVLIGMGMAGVASRILPSHVGSAWSYAPPSGGSTVAPGQIDAGRLLREFRFRRVSPRTQVYAVVGQPIAHSISPAMHNAAFETLDIDAVYIPCEAADFDDFLALADALPIAGASVTAPFKLDAFERSRPAADDEDARRVGAVNTLRRSVPALRASAPTVWESRNTDVAGFLAPLGTFALRGARAAVLGTGGAARAVVIGLGTAGARVTVHARNPTAGAEVAALANGAVRDWDVPAGSWDLLVNTTPIGTHPAVDDTPYAGSFARGDQAGEGEDEAAGARVVYDLVYNPRPTRLLREAAAAGCATLDGLDMLVEQAARQFSWWTGRTAPIDIMRVAAERRLAEMADHSATSSTGSTTHEYSART